jgi:hypothetical protein
MCIDYEEIGRNGFLVSVKRKKGKVPIGTT